MPLKRCRECNEPVSTKAAKCPKCGIKRPGNTNRELFLGNVAVLIIATGLIISIFSCTIKQQASQVEKQDSQAVRAIYQTTAQQLYVDYEKNEVAADEKMNGKIIEVTGRIKSIDKDFTDSVVILLFAGNEFNNASMFLSASEKEVASTLTKGMLVTLDCSKMRRVLSSPAGYECTFKRGEPNPQSGHTAAQELASCLMQAATTYNVPPAILIGIMQVEDGHVGEEAAPEKDGSYVMGPMHVSSQLLPQLAQNWKVDIDAAHKRLRDNGCTNVKVAAWVLRQKIDETGSYYTGIASYHSSRGKSDSAYAKKVIEAMRSKGLVNDDTKLLQENQP